MQEGMASTKRIFDKAWAGIVGIWMEWALQVLLP
jgi:hypothetical protein